MTTSAARSRIFPARARKSYRLEMEGRTLYLLLGLLALTGVVVFYLGVVTGMAMRNPNQPIPAVTQAPPPQAEKAPADTGSVALNGALESNTSTIEGLRVSGNKVSAKTENLISRARKELDLEEVKPGSAAAPSGKSAAAPAKTAAPAPPKVKAPAAAVAPPRRPAAPAAPPARPAAAPASEEGLFTVQVFSSQSQHRAENLLSRLKKLGFSAYMNRFQAADNRVWYRVRVGKVTRSEAESLSGRLKAEAHVRNTKVLKL